MPALEVVDLVVRYGDVEAVSSVSFSAERGEIVALLGPNGAGKTTTVETLEGYRRVASGRVRVLDLDPVADHSRLVPRMGVMLQGGGVYPGMTPRDAVRLFTAYYDDPLDPGEVLDAVGLAAVARLPWRRLSGGERQRLSLALALVGRPEILFLDEPTAGVDPAGRVDIRHIVRDRRENGSCVLLTTHELEEAERLADRVVILDHGRVVAEGTPADLMRNASAGAWHFGAPPDLDVVSLSEAAGASVFQREPGEYTVTGEPTPAAVASVTAWLAARDVPLGDLRAGRQRLEDVFFRLTAERPDTGEDR